MFKSNLIWLTIFTIFFSGCASVNYRSSSKQTELGNEYRSYKAPSDPVSGDYEFGKPTGIITLRDAVSAALTGNTELRSFSWEVRAREAAEVQAGLYPNPVVKTELENFSGTGELEGLDLSESTIMLSQLIPLGGKISKRKKVASLKKELAGWDYETVKLDVLTMVARRFVDLLAVQKRVELSRELLELSNKVYRTISIKAEAGEISPIEEKRAMVALSQTRIRHERVLRDLESARKNLAATWGSMSPSFEAVTGELNRAPVIPSYKELIGFIRRNPDVARWNTEMAERQATVKLEEAKAIPDITVSGGARWLNEIDDQGFLFGVSVPLVLFDRNQGNILEARYRLVKAEHEKESVKISVSAELAMAYRDLSSAYIEVRSLEKDVIPSAKSAYGSIFEGYRQGKFDFLDVLDSQRTLFDARFQYISALADYHNAVTEIERLTATPIKHINSK